MKEQVEKYVKNGDLARIVMLLDNRETHNEDFAGFRRALKEYSDLQREEYDLKEKLENPKIFGKTFGREVSAVFSSILSGIIIFGFAFFFFYNKF